ncbi:hypothetical protein JL721_4496 [Aureococcus anophagefferens]|nr:hypothetical protein JL721_4496 [Aureococcus anophagefferens]
MTTPTRKPAAKRRKAPAASPSKKRANLLGDVWDGDRGAAEIRREVVAPFGADMRADFVVSGGAKDAVVEVKTVVDSDFDVGFGDGTSGGPRAAIFPWGNSNQKGPDGEKVVSARAIKHVDALADIAVRQRRAACSSSPYATARSSSPTPARPSFAAHLRAASRAGVAVLARKLRWDVADGVARAYDAGPVPVDLLE